MKQVPCRITSSRRINSLHFSDHNESRMKTTGLSVLGITGALLLGSDMVQAGDSNNRINQRSQVWSMQCAQNGSYTD